MYRANKSKYNPKIPKESRDREPIQRLQKMVEVHLEISKRGTGLKLKKLSSNFKGIPLLPPLEPPLVIRL